jgi:elongation factor P
MRGPSCFTQEADGIMAKISGSDIRPGMMIEYESGLWAVVKTVTVKPGKGPAYNQAELKNVRDGRKLNNRFSTDERVEEVRLEFRDFQYLYKEGDDLVFMNTENYEQLTLAGDFVGERAAFLQDGMQVTLKMHDEAPVSIKLPEYVTLEVTEADPVIKGQSASSSYKRAKLENGLDILVPPFITAGEKIVVDTNEVTYLRRAE